MDTYNKIMRYFWLFAAISLALIITFLSIKDGFNKWAFYYVFVAVSLGMYLMKTYMMKRMEKHLKYLEEVKNQENNQSQKK
jgi:heme exporter protein D